MAKKQEVKPSQLKQLLSKRVEVTKGKTLGRDVKTPKWLQAIGAYFVGAWQELRQVKWPTRKATWNFTAAVVIFTLAMSAFILALDYGFEQLFKKVIL